MGESTNACATLRCLDSPSLEYAIHGFIDIIGCQSFWGIPEVVLQTRIPHVKKPGCQSPGPMGQSSPGSLSHPVGR